MTAGPTPLPPRVLSVMAEPVVYHRAPAFDTLFARVLDRLSLVFQTSNDVMVFAASGSGAMESAVANLVGPGEPILACAAGKFGERWIELGEAHGADVVRYEPGWGARLDPDEVDQRLAERPEIQVVFATLSETSTGVVHDVQALAEVVRRHDAMLVVDAVSGLGAAECRQDEWGIDVAVTGSQKALMTPPGPGFAVHAARLAARRPGRRARDDRGRGDGTGAGPSRPAGPRHARRRRRSRPGPLRRPRRARHGRHRGRAARHDRRRQGPGAPAQAGHHGQRRPGSAQGSHPAHRALRLLRRLRHRRPT